MSKPVQDIASGVVSTLADFILFSLYFGGEIVMSGHSGLTYSGMQKSEQKAEFLASSFDSKKLARALRHLLKKGLVITLQDGAKKAEITRTGKRRILAKFPHYDEMRVWDGSFYLVTYDIPVKHNKDRNSLREFLKKTGCAPFQDSVWITPYNPRDLVNEFSGVKGINGTVLVSTLAQDSLIGGFDIRELVERVYNLKELSERYVRFIQRAQLETDTLGLVLEYYSVLKDDPQLPFELLPAWWQGSRAYIIYRNMVGTDDYDEL